MKIYFLVPVGIAIALAWGFGLLLNISQPELPQLAITPFPESENAIATPAPYLNTGLVIALMGVSGTIVFALLKRGSLAIKYFIAINLGMLGFSVTTFYLILLSAILYLGPLDYLIGFSFFISFMLAVIILNGGEIMSLGALSYIGAGVGVMWAGTLPFWTTIVLLIAISAFDVFAVFKGYLSSIRNATNDRTAIVTKLKGLLIDFRGTAIGLGDIFFYALAVAFALLNFGVLSALFVSGGILAGSLANAMILSNGHGKAIPGLPIPILLSLGLLFLSTLLVV